MNQFMTICAILPGASQIIFAFNFFYSLFFGPQCGRNPWHANTLEWSAPSPPGTATSTSSRSSIAARTNTARPKWTTDYYPQTQPPPENAHGCS